MRCVIIIYFLNRLKAADHICYAKNNERKNGKNRVTEVGN